MNADQMSALAEQFRREVSEPCRDGGLYYESDWHSLTAGWAIGKGIPPDEAYEFATYIRYKTNLA